MTRRIVLWGAVAGCAGAAVIVRIVGGPAWITYLLVILALATVGTMAWTARLRLRRTDRHTLLQSVALLSGTAVALLGAIAVVPDNTWLRIALLVLMTACAVVSFVTNQQIATLSSAPVHPLDVWHQAQVEETTSRLSLPSRPDPFVGLGHRQAVDQLEKSTRMLSARGSGVLAVIGGPGRGKSTVIAELLSRQGVAERFGEGRRYFDVAVHNDPVTMVKQIEPTTTLLVLDHIEEVPHNTRLELLDAAQRTGTVVVVGWRTLELPEDIVFDDSVTVSDLTLPHARLLFEKLAPEHQGDSRIEVGLRSLPLTALIVTHAALQSRGIHRLGRYFKDLRVDLLGWEFQAGRDSTRTAYELATRRLTDPERAFLVRLAALVDGLDYEETDLLGDEFAGCAGVLHRLVQRGVAEPVGHGARLVEWIARYLCHDGTLTDDMQSDVLRRVATRFRDLRGDATRRSFLDRHFADVIRSVRDPDDPTIDVLLRDAGDDDWTLPDRLYAVLALPGVQTRRDLLVANAELRLGDCDRLRDRYDAAEEHYNAAMTIYQEIGNRDGVAGAELRLGDCDDRRGQLDAAERHFNDAKKIYLEIGNRDGVANAEVRLGDCERRRGQLDAAERHFNDAKKIYLEIGSRDGVADAELRLGICERLRDELDAAERHFNDAKKIYLEIGSRDGEADAEIQFGEIDLSCGRFDDAKRHFSAAKTICLKIGNRDHEATSELGLGDCNCARGLFNAAEVHYTTAKTIYLEIGNRLGEGDAEGGLGSCDLGRGQFGAAERHFNDAKTIYLEIGNRFGEGEVEFGLGICDLGRGLLNEAKGHFDNAKTIYQKIGNRFREASVRDQLGDLSLSRGCSQEAIQSWASAEQIFREIGRIHDAQRVRNKLIVNSE